MSNSGKWINLKLCIHHWSNWRRSLKKLNWSLHYSAIANFFSVGIKIIFVVYYLFEAHMLHCSLVWISCCYIMIEQTVYRTQNYMQNETEALRNKKGHVQKYKRQFWLKSNKVLWFSCNFYFLNCETWKIKYMKWMQIELTGLYTATFIIRSIFEHIQSIQWYLIICRAAACAVSAWCMQ